MKISKGLNLLVIVTAVVLTTTAGAFADADLNINLTSEVQESLSITKISSTEDGDINPSTGEQSGLRSTFLIQTNGGASDYVFTINSTIDTQNGKMNAFGKDGCLLFANTEYLPSTDAVNNAKKGSGLSPNVIAYPLSMTINTRADDTSKMSVEWKESSKYGTCWVINPNRAKHGTLYQTVMGTPYLGTYEKGVDAKGQYKVTVTYTAVAK